VEEALRAGASAILLKQAAALELTEAVEKVRDGGSCVTPHAAKWRANIFLRGPQAREKVAEPTLRQREVIQLIAEGRSMKEAADILKITVRTVASHKYGAMELLQLKSNVELVQYPIKHNIISM
jgi:DNA-binding NarL/FixJ family response regulator